MANGDLHIKDVWEGVEIENDAVRATKDSLIMLSAHIQGLQCKLHEEKINNNKTNILLHENTHATEDMHNTRTAVIVSAVTSIIIAIVAILTLKG